MKERQGMNGDRWRSFHRFKMLVCGLWTAPLSRVDARQRVRWSEFNIRQMYCGRVRLMLRVSYLTTYICVID